MKTKHHRILRAFRGTFVVTVTSTRSADPVRTPVGFTRWGSRAGVVHGHREQVKNLEFTCSIYFILIHKHVYFIYLTFTNKIILINSKNKTFISSDDKLLNVFIYVFLCIFFSSTGHKFLCFIRWMLSIAKGDYVEK